MPIKIYTIYVFTKKTHLRPAVHRLKQTRTRWFLFCVLYFFNMMFSEHWAIHNAMPLHLVCLHLAMYDHQGYVLTVQSNYFLIEESHIWILQWKHKLNYYDCFVRKTIRDLLHYCSVSQTVRRSTLVHLEVIPGAPRDAGGSEGGAKEATASPHKTRRDWFYITSKK